MAMGGKATEGGPGPVVLDGQVLERSCPARDADSPEWDLSGAARMRRVKCFGCFDKGYVETRQRFPATKYRPECTVIDSVRCPRCGPVEVELLGGVVVCLSPREAP